VLPPTLSAAQLLQFTAPAGHGVNAFTAAYPTDGGNITISAVDDIRSAPSTQLASDWLWRRGAVNLDGTLIGPKQNTTWWIVFSNFAQGIGALGGGDISLSAGRDVDNVSAVIPTTGRLLGAAGTVPARAGLLVNGGGNLQIRAGGDIKSGVFEDDWGNAAIDAGGALTTGTTVGVEIPAVNGINLNVIQASTPIYPVLLLGSGSFDVNARSGVTLNMVGNSTSLPETNTNIQAAKNASSYFYTYGAGSTLNLASAGGDVVLNNDSSNLPIGALNGSQPTPTNVYDGATYHLIFPSTLNVAALSGDISILGHQGVSLFPSATGNLSLLANGYITGSTTRDLSSNFAITMYESDPALWPSPTVPVSSSPDPTIAGFAALPLQPLHQDDSQPITMVADTGSISASNLTFPKAADVIAGGNITDLTLTGKNLNPSDATLIEAAGSISYSTPTNPVTNALLSNTEGVSLAGPGYLEVLAGRSLNLGDSSGLVTSGSLNDSRLHSAGATLVVGAGLGNNSDGSLRQPAYQPFINKYLTPDSVGSPSAYTSDLIAFLQQLNPAANSTLDYSAALTAFQALTSAQQLPFLAQVLSDELSATGLAHTTQGASYDRGYTAINTLFPTTNAQGKALTYQGDINMFFSQLKTEQGGDINLLAPGGSVVVGVPNPPAALAVVKGNAQISAAAELGVLVLAQGAIQGFANQNFEVNQSRILTLEGGNIILWASNGNIDAGRGAKSASGAPPPVIQTDANGRVFVNPINDVSGSGIGQLLTTPGLKAGLVNLIAPKGDVNAGDAGIRVAGNLNIAAVQVIGAGNITVVGTATGVPVSQAGALAGALSGANSAGDASKSAIDQLGQDLGGAANYQQLTESLQPSFIVVKMFCLGVECEAR
jgi:hypothetical protein